jgi:hypothetical protein
MGSRQRRQPRCGRERRLPDHHHAGGASPAAVGLAARQHNVGPPLGPSAGATTECPAARTPPLARGRVTKHCLG